jgi:hypothetical protein
VGQKRVRGAAAPLLGFALLALVLAGCASQQHQRSTHSQPAGAAKPRVTTTITFHAYDSAGQLTIKVGDVARGRCWTTSIAAPVAGAYRCFAANQILDPCFAPPTKAPTEVACVANPWADAVVLHLTGALPKSNPSDYIARPWALRLDDGVSCVASTGTVPSVHGIDLGYHCSNGLDAALLDRNASPQTADYGDPATDTLQPVTVTTIWQG